MTTEIIVFQPPEQKEITLTKSERELLYEEFERHSPLEPHHFRAFYDMETEDINESTLKSTIASVMFKNILDINVEPIVSEIPKLDLRVKKRQTRVDTQDTTDSGYFFTIQFTKETRGCLLTPSGGTTSTMLSPDISYKIVGIRIPKNIRFVRDMSIPNFLAAINIFHLTTMGNYGLRDFKTGAYTQQRNNFPHLPRDKKSELAGKIVFTSNEHALDVISKLVALVDEMRDYYETELRTLYTSMQFGPFLRYRSILSEKSTETRDRVEVLPLMTETAETKKVREIFTGKLPKQMSRFLYSLYNNGIFDMYNKINMLGIGHTTSQKILENMVEANTHRSIIQTQKKKKSESYLEFAKKQTISLEKFKVSNLTDLTPEQRKIVELQYNNLKKIEKGAHTMSESLNLAANLYASLDSMDFAELKRNITAITNVIGTAELDDSELIKDTQGVQFLCPHTLARAKKLLEVSAFIRSDPGKLTQVRDFVINNYTLPDVSVGYYCRICGALLADQDEDDIVQFLPRDLSVSSDIRQAFIWKEVAYIITTFVKFKDSVNVKKIITSITNSIKGEIGVIESKLTKIRTNNVDSTKDLLRIYITVYTYAVIIQMIYLNYGKITFVNRETKRGGSRRRRSSQFSKFVSNPVHESPTVIGVDDCTSSDEPEKESDEPSPFVSVRGAKMDNDRRKTERKVREHIVLQNEDKKRLQNIFKVAIELIIRSKNSLINKMSNISIDSIKPILIKAYKWVVSLKQSVDSTDSIREPNTAYFLSIDPIFEYLWYAHSLKHFSSQKTSKDNKITKTGLERTDIVRYLGRTLVQIEEGYAGEKTIYDTAVPVEPWGTNIKAKYDHGSFMFVFQYTKDKIYHNTIVPMSERVSNFVSSYAYLDKLADEITQKTILQNIHPFMAYPSDNTVFMNNNFAPSRINVADHYCHDGAKHKFDIFVFDKILKSGVLSSDDQKELKAKDVSKWIDDPNPAVARQKMEDFKLFHLTDEKCSKCGVLLSKIKKDASIDKKLAQLAEFRAFYDYFEDRCPEGNLHDYRIDAKKNIEDCTKCGFTRSLLEKLDTVYHTKYLSKYQGILKERKDLDESLLAEFKLLSREYDLNSKKYPDWQIDNNAILKLSRSTDVKYNILINLGLNEGRKYENIEKEKENPHINSTEEEDILRNQYLHDYCMWLLRSYYVVKNYNTVYAMDPRLKELIEKHRKEGTNLIELRKVLPDLYNEFNETYSYYFRTLNPKTLANYLLNYMCVFMNKIIGDLTNTPFAKLGRDFVQYAINVIIQSEKDVSQPPPLSIIIDHGSTNTPVTEELAAEEFIDMSEIDEEANKSLDELEDALDGDDFDRNDIDMGDDFDSDTMDMNPADN